MGVHIHPRIQRVFIEDIYVCVCMHYMMKERTRWKWTNASIHFHHFLLFDQCM